MKRILKPVIESHFTALAYVLIILASSSCVYFSDDHSVSHGTSLDWHKGSVEDAFAKARKSNKHLLLYWGATWCPPCNELKSQVFSKPQFAELMHPVIPVYLDGDSEAAQIWGDKLKASGYPTILLLTPDGKEKLRLSEALTMTEFEAVFRSAIKENQNQDQLLKKAAKGKASEEDWRLLAYASWQDPQDPQDPQAAERQLKNLLRAANRVPHRLVSERSLLASILLVKASQGKATATKNKVKAKAGRYLAATMVDDNSIFAARSLLVYYAEDILKWAYPKPEHKLRLLMEKKWLLAVARLRAQERISHETRLWTSYPELQFFKLENPEDKTVPSRIKTSIINAVNLADKRSETDFERQAIISGAAYLLQQAGEVDRARSMLIKEAKSSDSRWYYYSALASLETRQKKTRKKPSAGAASRATQRKGRRRSCSGPSVI